MSLINSRTGSVESLCSTVISLPKVAEEYLEQNVEDIANLLSGSSDQPNLRQMERKTSSQEFKEMVDEFKMLGTAVNWKQTAEEIVGYDEVKAKIVKAFLNDDLDSSLRLKAFLLAGLPGTGKTSLLLSAAVNVSIVTRKTVSVFVVKVGDLMSKYHGETEKRIPALFSAAKAMSPSVIIIDEVDGIMKKRSSTESDFSRSFKTTLMSELQGASDTSGIVVICSTNRPYDIDSAFMRRFQGIFSFYLPDEMQRKAIFQKFLRILAETRNVDLPNVDVCHLAKNTDGYTGDDIRKIVQEAGNNAKGIMYNGVHHNVDQLTSDMYKELAKNDNKPPSSASQVTNACVLKALEGATKSYNIAEFRDMRAWEKERGMRKSAATRTEGTRYKVLIDEGLGCFGCFII